MNMLKLSWIISIILLGISIYIIQGIPSDTQLPVHWNIDGAVDRYGDASTVLFMLPAVLMIILALFSALKYIDPRKENIAMSHKSIGAFSLAFSVFVAVMEAGYIAVINDKDVQIMLIITFSMGMLFMMIGNYLSKTRSNFFIGIRTPWTLSSDVVWKKTHDFAGKLFMLAGLVIAGGCWFIDTSTLMTLVIFTVVPAALVPVVYSWWLWQQEQAGQSKPS
ncbi:MAG: SdpI family protein [Colwellia sp.]|nr:SdpI family protein [Colwellia sp.]